MPGAPEEHLDYHGHIMETARLDLLIPIRRREK